MNVSPLRTYGPVGVAVAFVIVSVLNVVPATNQIPADVPPYEEPIQFQGQDDLLSLAERHGEFVRSRHLFYLQLGAVVDGRPVITSPDTFLDPGRVRGLARTQLVVRERGLRVEDDVASALLELPAYRGKFAHHRRGRLPYVIVRTTSGSRSPFLTMRHEGTLIVVEEGILDGLTERGS